MGRRLSSSWCWAKPWRQTIQHCIHWITIGLRWKVRMQVLAVSRAQSLASHSTDQSEQLCSTWSRSVTGLCVLLKASYRLLSEKQKLAHKNMSNYSRTNKLSDVYIINTIFYIIFTEWSLHLDCCYFCCDCNNSDEILYNPAVFVGVTSFTKQNLAKSTKNKKMKQMSQFLVLWI